MNACPACKTRQGDPTLCNPCSSRLLEHLVALPALYERLGERLQPKGRGGEKVTSTRGSETGINLDDRIIRLRKNIRENLPSWARVVVDERKVTPPHQSLPAIAGFLRLHHDWLCALPDAHRYASDIEDAWHTAQPLIVPAKAREFGGKCRHQLDDSSPCPGQIILDPENDTAQCFICGTTTTITEHWRTIFGVVDDDWLGTTTEIQQLLTLRDGTWINPNTFQSWIRRKRLTSRGERHGARLYRIGDVIDLNNGIEAKSGKVGE